MTSVIKGHFVLIKLLFRITGSWCKFINRNSETTLLIFWYIFGNMFANLTWLQQLQPLNGLFSRTTWVSRYQKGKTNLDFTGARDGEWQWHQLGHMQVHLAPVYHARTPPFFYSPDALFAAQPTASKHWRIANETYQQNKKYDRLCDVTTLCNYSIRCGLLSQVPWSVFVGYIGESCSAKVDEQIEMLFGHGLLWSKELYSCDQTNYMLGGEGTIPHRNEHFWWHTWACLHLPGVACDRYKVKVK